MIAEIVCSALICMGRRSPIGSSGSGSDGASASSARRIDIIGQQRPDARCPGRSSVRRPRPSNRRTRLPPCRAAARPVPRTAIDAELGARAGIDASRLGLRHRQRFVERAGVRFAAVRCGGCLHCRTRHAVTRPVPPIRSLRGVLEQFVDLFEFLARIGDHLAGRVGGVDGCVGCGRGGRRRGFVGGASTAMPVRISAGRQLGSGFGDGRRGLGGGRGAIDDPRRARRGRSGASCAAGCGASPAGASSGSASGRSSAAGSVTAASICSGARLRRPPRPERPGTAVTSAAIASAAASNCRSLSDRRERSIPFSLARIWSTVSDVIVARLE